MTGAQTPKFYNGTLTLNCVLARGVIATARPPVFNQVDFGLRFKRGTADFGGKALAKNFREEGTSNNLTHLRRPKE